jgi:glutathione S-transferase
MSNELKLYHSAASPNSRRVRIFLAEKGIATRLAEAPYVAGNTFSAADITALVTVDFATKAMSFSVPGEHAALERWYENVSSRPSVEA